MDNIENQPEDQGNGSSNDTNFDDNTNAIPQRNLTVSEVTQLIQCYSLPEGTVADMEKFQWVFS